MKISSHITLFLVLPFYFLVTQVQAQSKPAIQPKALINSWKLNEKSVPVFASIMIERTKKANAEQAKQLEANPDALTPFIRAIQYTFNADGVYESISPQGAKKSSWKIKGSKLITQLTGGPERTDSIISITANKVVLFNPEVRKNIEYALASAATIRPASTEPSVNLEKEKQEILALVDKFKKAIIQKDTAGLASLFYKDKVVWISVAHPTSLAYIKKLNPKVQPIEQAGAFQSIADPKFKKIAMEEIFLNPEIITDGRIGSISFDYAFKSSGILTNWGKENWQLVKSENTWFILNLIYSYHLQEINPAPAKFKDK
ncbi:lipocalin-like domain-containing protein [Hymenobacter terrenus]|uniref:lipocalin family protein n=1 Tax=Hymenobacter terrenus TaxID=1629124 RepID=UPI000696ED06|nr:lipocalin family protein [Hymenobacter terrenus]